MDIRMPVLDGIAGTRLILQQFDADRPRIIILTTFGLSCPSLATPRSVPADVTQQLLALRLPERVRLRSTADRGLVAQPGS